MDNEKGRKMTQKEKKDLKILNEYIKEYNRATKEYNKYIDKDDDETLEIKQLFDKIEIKTKGMKEEGLEIRKIRKIKTPFQKLDLPKKYKDKDKVKENRFIFSMEEGRVIQPPLEKEKGIIFSEITPEDKISILSKAEEVKLFLPFQIRNIIENHFNKKIAEEEFLLFIEDMKNKEDIGEYKNNISINENHLHLKKTKREEVKKTILEKEEEDKKNLEKNKESEITKYENKEVEKKLKKSKTKIKILKTVSVFLLLSSFSMGSLYLGYDWYSPINHQIQKLLGRKSVNEFFDVGEFEKMQTRGDFAPSIGEQFGRMYIPKIGIKKENEIKLIYGFDEAMMESPQSSDYVGLEESPKFDSSEGELMEPHFPGDGSLGYYNGHRNNSFSALEKIELGAVILIEVPYGIFAYKVTKIEDGKDQDGIRRGISEENTDTLDDYSVIGSDGVKIPRDRMNRDQVISGIENEPITLQTCFPFSFGSTTTDRFLVQANLMDRYGFENRSQEEVDKLVQELIQMYEK